MCRRVRQACTILDMATKCNAIEWMFMTVLVRDLSSRGDAEREGRV